MSDKNEHQKEQAAPLEQAEPETVPPLSEEDILMAINSDETEAEGSGFSNPLEALAAENTRQEDEIADLKDQLLRSAAEMQNLRRRTQKDVADARSFSISGFARDMLGVADNLRRAIEHVDDADKEHAGLKTLIEGVEMTERELLNVMEKNGVKQISPQGERFDPNFHQAMFEVANPELPNNTVAQVVQVGYVIGERVLRPAMVGVAKGGPKASEVPEPKEAVEKDGN